MRLLSFWEDLISLDWREYGYATINELFDYPRGHRLAALARVLLDNRLSLQIAENREVEASSIKMAGARWKRWLGRRRRVSSSILRCSCCHEFSGRKCLAALAFVGIALVTGGCSESTAMASSTPEPQAGDLRNSIIDGMEMVYIPAGIFQMGSEAGDTDEEPVHDVYLDAYWIDRTEVTNAMYAECVEARMCEVPSRGSSYTHSEYFDNPAYANYPVIFISSFGAESYCAWAGRRLPTEAEWEHAARGDDGRMYPWGEEDPTCAHANHGGCEGDTSEVGAYPMGASPYGLMDMAGNVWEWVADWYAEDAYTSLSASNPKGTSSSSARVGRGGSWHRGIRSADRGRFDPANNLPYLGFRCAVAASP